MIETLGHCAHFPLAEHWKIPAFCLVEAGILKRSGLAARDSMFLLSMALRLPQAHFRKTLPRCCRQPQATGAAMPQRARLTLPRPEQTIMQGARLIWHRACATARSRPRLPLTRRRTPPGWRLLRFTTRCCRATSSPASEWLSGRPTPAPGWPGRSVHYVLIACDFGPARMLHGWLPLVCKSSPVCVQEPGVRAAPGQAHWRGWACRLNVSPRYLFSCIPLRARREWVVLPDQDPDDLRALLACMAANGLVPDIAAVQTVPIAPYVFLQTAAYNGRHAGFVPAGTRVRAI